jgi:RecB family exonuclease
VARKPTLSPSKISTYLACPSKYMWTYVDDRGKWFLRSKSYYSFGTSLHAVLQRFHDSGDAGVTTAAEAVAELEQSWIEAGYESQDHMMQAMAEGKQIVERYIDQVAALPATTNTVAVEKSLRLDLGPFVLLGRIDRIDRHDDGTIEVVDYKSGRETVSEADVATDLAMCCYQLLAREAYPTARVVASIVALRSNTRATAAMTDSEAEAFAADLRVIGEEILNRDYENLTPVGKALCHDCDFVTLCQRHEDFSVPGA